MSIYYKIYRRRQYVYAAAIFLSVLFTISVLNKPSEYDSSGSGSGPRRRGARGGDIDLKDKPDPDLNKIPPIQPLAGRININTYVEPETCKGCPGENGQGVSLTVRFHLL